MTSLPKPLLPFMDSIHQQILPILSPSSLSAQNMRTTECLLKLQPTITMPRKNLGQEKTEMNGNTVSIWGHLNGNYLWLSVHSDNSHGPHLPGLQPHPYDQVHNIFLG